MTARPPSLVGADDKQQHLNDDSSLDLELAKPPGHALDYGHLPSGDALSPPTTWYGKAWAWLMASDSIEDHGVGPVPEHARTDAHFISNFTIWLTMNMTISCFSAGTLGPLFYGLSLRDSTLVIVFCNLFSCGIPAYVATFGPRLGMRTMGIARYRSVPLL